MAQANSIGQGWHFQSIRHSNARRYGHADYSNTTKNKTHQRLIEEMRINHFEEHLNLPKKILDKIKPHEQELLKLYITQEEKDRAYQYDYDEFFAYGQGRKAGSLKRAKYQSYSKYAERLRQILGLTHDEALKSEETRKVYHYLQAKAHQLGMYEDDYFYGYIPFTPSPDYVKTKYPKHLDR